MNVGGSHDRVDPSRHRTHGPAPGPGLRPGGPGRCESCARLAPRRRHRRPRRSHLRHTAGRPAPASSVASSPRGPLTTRLMTELAGRVDANRARDTPSSPKRNSTVPRESCCLVRLRTPLAGAGTGLCRAHRTGVARATAQPALSRHVPGRPRHGRSTHPPCHGYRAAASGHSLTHVQVRLVS